MAAMYHFRRAKAINNAGDDKDLPHCFFVAFHQALGLQIVFCSPCCYNTVITRKGGEMIKQLRKVGNSNALILDKPILELLGLEEDGQVQLTIQDGNLIVTPTHPRRLDAENLQKKLDYVVKKRRQVLKRLAQ
jgi:antitoxin component of MazEF toxin-antitoxin module